MKIHVIGAPRCGGTAFAYKKSIESGYIFVNEPYKFDCVYQVANSGGIVEYGGGYGVNNLDIINEYIAHHIPTQYLTRYPRPVSDHQLILINRRDKWQQLLSYCSICVLNNISNFHNINYIKSEIYIPKILVQRMFSEWILWDMIKQYYTVHEILIYEDINLENDKFVKNIGYENIMITNLEEIRKLYDNFWESRYLN